MSDTWTNDSVRRFAAERDPIDAVLDTAREVAFNAAAEGWAGPPFDPLSLARHLGIRVVPRDSVADARMVHEDTGSFIEYNPLRPRGRLRFSIAHEIAHSFFGDVADAPRYRTGQGAVATANDDAWQLELLCNIAAAELLMPNLSLPFDELDRAPLDVDVIMQLRTKFDVSTEAIMRRIVSGTIRPSACIATSRLSDDTDGSPTFRIDYAMPSRSWISPLDRGDEIPSPSLAACTAVG